MGIQGLGRSSRWRSLGLATTGSCSAEEGEQWLQPEGPDGTGRQAPVSCSSLSCSHKRQALGAGPPDVVYKRLPSRPQCSVRRWKGSLGGKQYLVQTTQQIELEAEGKSESLGSAFQCADDHLEFRLPPNSGPPLSQLCQEAVR